MFSETLMCRRYIPFIFSFIFYIFFSSSSCWKFFFFSFLFPLKKFEMNQRQSLEPKVQVALFHFSLFYFFCWTFLYLLFLCYFKCSIFLFSFFIFKYEKNHPLVRWKKVLQARTWTFRRKKFQKDDDDDDDNIKYHWQN